MNHLSLLLTPAPTALTSLAARQHAEATSTLTASLAGLLDAEPTATIGLEFTAHNGEVVLVITAPPDWQDDLTNLIYAAYPTSELEPQPTSRTQTSNHTLTAAVQFTPAEAELRSFDFATVDPLSSLLEVLSTVPEGHRLTVRLLLSSPNIKSSLGARLVNGLGDLLLDTTRHALLPVKSEPAPQPEPTDPKTDAAILRANLFLISSAPTITAAETLIRRTSSAYHAFAKPGQTKLRYQILPTGRPRTTAQPHPTTAFTLTAAEAASLFHPPLTPAAFPRLKTLTATHLPIPAGLPESGVLIGHGLHRDHQPPVHLAPEDRLRHTYVIGATGTGKSTLFQNAMLQDMKNGDGACFIDPHGEAIEWLLDRVPPERAKDVILFDPADPAAVLGLNLLEWRTPDERDLLIQELIALFYKLFDPGRTGIIGPQFEHWLRSAALTVTEPNIRGTLLDIPRLFTDRPFQEATVADTTHPAARDFWLGQMAGTADFHKSEMLNYFTSKFGQFTGNAVMHEILSAKHSAFDLRTLMDRRKILLVNLSKGKLGSLNAQLLGTLIVTKLQLAALSRADVAPEHRPPFYVYIDEFQNLVTDSFAAMLSEIRKYGVGLHLAHQYVDQLPEPIKQAVAGNVGTLIAFRLGTTDARWIAPHFAPLSEADLTGLPAGQFHIRTLSGGQLTTPFTVAAPRFETSPQPELATAVRHRVRQFVAATRT